MVTADFTKRVSAVFGLVALVGLLSGCDSAASLHTDAIEVQLTPDGVVLIAVCEDIRVGRGYGAVRTEGDNEWVAFWEATGDATLEAGAVGQLGDAPFGLSATTDEVPSITAGDRMTVQLIPPDGTTDAYATFAFDDIVATTGKWISSSGEISSAPCDETT